MTPDVTIVIPTIAKNHHLRRTLDSIKVMAGPSFEVVVVDQSGAGDVKSLLSEYDGAVFHHVADDGRGRGRAIVYGALYARSRYLAFTDDDIIVEPDWLNAALRSFERHKPCHGVVGRISLFGEKPGEDYEPPWEIERTEEELLSVSTVWRGSGANQVFLREAWDSVGGMDPRVGTGGRCPGGDDVEILYRMFMHGLKLWYDPSVRVWHNGWEKKTARAMKRRCYDRAFMAVHIKCRLEAGGPALRQMAACCFQTCGRLLSDLIHRHRGCAKVDVLRLCSYLEGIPLGFLLAWEGRKGYQAMKCYPRPTELEEGVQ